MYIDEQKQGALEGFILTDVVLKIILPIFPWNINVLQDREHNSPVQIFNYSVDLCKTFYKDCPHRWQAHMHAVKVKEINTMYFKEREKF